MKCCSGFSCLIFVRVFENRNSCFCRISQLTDNYNNNDNNNNNNDNHNSNNDLIYIAIHEKAPYHSWKLTDNHK